MGFRFRKRTKGKDSWLNFSSGKKGFKSSLSMKFGDLTLNFGKGRVRSTYNLGNGLSYVKTRSTKAKKKSSTPVSSGAKFNIPSSMYVSEKESIELRKKYPDRRDLSESFWGYWLWVLFKTIGILVFLYVLIVFLVFIS